MTLDNYQEHNERRRLSNTQPTQRGIRSGLTAISGFLFGGIFLAVGAAIALIGLKVIPVNPSSVKAPYWILTTVGAVFGCAGLFIMGTGFRQAAINRRCKEAQRMHPDEPAFSDYPWDPRYFGATRWRDAIRSLAVAIVLTVFLVPFNWWAFVDRNWFIRIVVGVFDVIAVFCWSQAILMIGRAMKFGDSRITFHTFPYDIRQPVAIHWLPPHGVGSANKGEFTLRCVEEWWEVTGTGKNRNKQLIQEEIWRGVHTFSHPQAFLAGDTLELTFTPPPHLPETKLNAEKPVFWEFEVKLDLAGFDFIQTYLVPVYRRG